ncbi:hypothetical protein [Halomonas mongoliensis]|uniref:hypothetical protein n=1 Tax=Halomonas mongoliensis TaxID=321265 RepID=UPI00403B0BD7
MRLKTLLATAIAAAALPLAASAQASCQDDERLYAMGNFLEAQRNGTAEPLRLTAETYLNLTPRAREIIGDNLRLLDASCNAMQVVDGEPPAKVEMPFPVLYNAFESAVLRGDERTAKIVINGFRTGPVDSATFMGLLTTPSLDSGLMQRLATSAGINPHRGIGNNCRHETSYIMFADLFVRLGGTVEGYGVTPWFVSGSKPEVTSVGDNQLTREFSRLPNNCEVSKESVLAVATSAGAISIDVGNQGQRHWSNQGRRAVMGPYENWLEAGAPDDARPQSLFD